MNEVEETLKEINITIAFFERKKMACQEAIDELEKEKDRILEKYNLKVK